MCERWVGDWTDCNILTHSSSIFWSTSFSFCWAVQSGVLRAQPSLGAGSHHSILSPTNPNCLSHRVISLFDIHLFPVIVAYVPNSTHPRWRLYLDVFDRMHRFIDWRLGWRSICYSCRIHWFYILLCNTDIFILHIFQWLQLFHTTS